MSLFASIEDLIQTYAAQPKRFSWFLGAGASRTAGMPTASDLIWELKFRQYCRRENKNVSSHDWSNQTIRSRVQSYFDSKSAPENYAASEYSYYFKQEFGDDLSSQQKFIQEQFHPDKIALNIGQRALAAMMTMESANVVFTTNFDYVLETAVASVTGKSLTAYHLEGSYAALDALTADQFPIYAKLHGDFRYRSLKNLEQHLRRNDEDIQKCFLVACNRFGCVVSGFSGRDQNVMELFESALAQPNPFPSGLFWTVTRKTDVSQNVVDLITAATKKGIKAALVEVATFDVLMAKLWNQIPGKTIELEERVSPKISTVVSISIPSPGKRYPILRTNALVIASLPEQCGRLKCRRLPTFDEIRTAQNGKIPDSAYTLESELLYWGSRSEVRSWVPDSNIVADEPHHFGDVYTAVAGSTKLKGLFEEGLARALCADRPIVLRKKGRDFYAVASTRPSDAAKLEVLRRAIAFQGSAPTSGALTNLNATWSEALSIKLDFRDRKAFLLLEPDIWISPLATRELAQEFMKARQVKRYNPQANRILDAWIQIILGSGIVPGSTVEVTAFSEGDHPASFGIISRTAYSGRE